VAGFDLLADSGGFPLVAAPGLGSAAFCAPPTLLHGLVSVEARKRNRRRLLAAWIWQDGRFAPGCSDFRVPASAPGLSWAGSGGGVSYYTRRVEGFFFLLAVYRG